MERIGENRRELERIGENVRESERTREKLRYWRIEENNESGVQCGQVSITFHPNVWTLRGASGIFPKYNLVK